MFEFGLIWQNNDKHLNIENRLIFYVKNFSTTKNKDIYPVLYFNTPNSI